MSQVHSVTHVPVHSPVSCTGCCFCDDEAGFFSPVSSSPLFSALLKETKGSVQGRRRGCYETLCADPLRRRRNLRVFDNPPGTRTNRTSMSDSGCSQQLRIVVAANADFSGTSRFTSELPVIRPEHQRTVKRRRELTVIRTDCGVSALIHASTGSTTFRLAGRSANRTPPTTRNTITSVKSLWTPCIQACTL
jgi:hypothetical protein